MGRLVEVVVAASVLAISWSTTAMAEGLRSDRPELAAAPADAPDIGSKAAGDPLIATIRALVIEQCAVAPARFSAEPDAVIVRLSIDSAKADCLNEVALRIDRRFPNASPIIFETETAAEPLDRPVIHVSAIHAGSSPYLHLQDGKTLFLGAIVDGWELTSIDERGAEFTRDHQSFRLTTPIDGAPR